MPFQSPAAHNNLVDFARTLHFRESELIASVEGGADPVKALSKFYEQFMTDDAFSATSSAALVDHSLWRLLSNTKLRQAAIELTPFLDPMAAAVQQAELIAVLGRFVDDTRVAEFLTDVAEGSAMGLICLNQAAMTKAQEKIERIEEPPRVIPSQDDDRVLTRG